MATYIYDNANFGDSTPSQMSFPSAYDLDNDPVAAMTSYSKVMHQHTKRQMEAATCAARRGQDTEVPVNGGGGQPATLSQQDTRGSMSSTGST